MLHRARNCLAQTTLPKHAAQHAEPTEDDLSSLLTEL